MESRKKHSKPLQDSTEKSSDNSPYFAADLIATISTPEALQDSTEIPAISPYFGGDLIITISGPDETPSPENSSEHPLSDSAENFRRLNVNPYFIQDLVIPPAPKVSPDEAIEFTTTESGNRQKIIRPNARSIIMEAQKLGEGVFGNVTKATTNDQPIAVKQSKDPQSLMPSPAKLRSFFKTVNEVPGLLVPNDVRQDQITKTTYSIMQLMDGGNGTELIELLPTLPKHKMRTILSHLFFSLLDASVAMQQRGIKHLDLKPSNVLYDANGNIKAIDFDFSILFKKNGKRIKHQPSNYLQDMRYAATEITDMDKDCRGLNSEQFSQLDYFRLGATLFEFFCVSKEAKQFLKEKLWFGFNKYLYINTVAKKIKHLDSLKQEMRQVLVNQDYPDLFIDVIMGFLNPDPEQRLTFQQAQDKTRTMLRPGQDTVIKAFDELAAHEQKEKEAKKPTRNLSSSAPLDDQQEADLSSDSDDEGLTDHEIKRLLARIQGKAAIDYSSDDEEDDRLLDDEEIKQVLARIQGPHKEETGEKEATTPEVVINSWDKEPCLSESAIEELVVRLSTRKKVKRVASESSNQPKKTLAYAPLLGIQGLFPEPDTSYTSSANSLHAASHCTFAVRKRNGD